MSKKVPRNLTEQVRDHFDYEPLTGTLIRKKGRNRDLGPAGCVRSRGYIKISFMDTSYLAHRLIWLWLHGTINGECIDHIDGDTSNNRINNLRCVTLSENQHNQYRNRTHEIKSRCKQELREQAEPSASS